MVVWRPLAWVETPSCLISSAVLQVACENSPSSVTISGDSDAVQLSLEKITVTHPDVFTRKLHVNIAYHSRKAITLTCFP